MSMPLDKVLLISGYSLLIFISLIGNVLVCAVVSSIRSMRTTTNLLIVSLACSDILMTVFNIPFSILPLLPLTLPYETFTCHLLPILQNTSIHVSSFTMMHIALHRWWIVHKHCPSTVKTSKSKFLFTVFGTWVTALLLSLPIGLIFSNCSKKGQGQPLIFNCNLQFILTLTAIVTQFLLPLSITLVVYIKIGKVIHRQGRFIQKMSDKHKRKQSESKRKRIFMLALVVVIFTICWAPFNLYIFLVDSGFIRLSFKIVILHWFAMSSVCYNPIIYFIFNEKFRKGAKQIITSWNSKFFTPLFCYFVPTEKIIKQEFV